MDEAPCPGKGAMPLTTSTERQMTMAWARLPDAIGIIYVVADGIGHFKIGATTDGGLVGRMEGLQTGNPFRLTLIHSRQIDTTLTFHAEKMTHQYLAAKRVRGEWFRGKRDDIIAAVNLCVNRALSMDYAIEELMVIAEQQKELYRSKESDEKSNKTKIQEIMAADILRPERLGATIRTTHGSLRAPSRGKQRRKI